MLNIRRKSDDTAIAGGYYLAPYTDIVDIDTLASSLTSF